MRKTFVKKKPASSDVSLQITSMADIFMILLVFLLKNYSTSITNLAPSATINLPEITKGQGQIKETLKLEVGANTIAVDQKSVVRLKNFEFAPEEQGADGTSEAVYQILNRQRSLLPEPNVDSALIVMADQLAPYSTIKRVVASAAKAGFVDLQLIVVETE